MITRREFLKAGSLLGVSPLIPQATPNLLLAPVAAPNPGNGKFFVMIRVQFGMDCTLGLDPWLDATPPAATDMFVEYKQDDLIEIVPGQKVAPAAVALKNHAGDFSIVNGVFMSQVDNGHVASLALMTRTSHAGTAPNLPVELAASSQEGDFGVLSNLGLEMGTRVTTTSVLSDLAQIQAKFDVSEILAAIFGASTSKTPYVNSVRKVVASHDSVQTFVKNLSTFGSSPQEAQVMAAAFMTDMAYYAQLDLTSFNLDTHAAHPQNHLKEQTRAWEAVSDMFKLFKATPYGSNGESLFDRTTFMVLTEFSRTPALNSAQGKDHNPMTNSCLIGGRGIRGGQVIGASRLVTAQESLTGASYHIAYPIDYQTGDVQRTRTKQAQMIFPENVGQTIASVMGVDRSVFASIPANTPMLNKLIK